MAKVVILLASVVLASVPVSSEAALYAFWSTPEKDGYVQKLTYPGGFCPYDYEPKAIGKGRIAACQASYKPYSLYVWDRMFFSFDTSPLAGQTVDSAVVKFALFRKNAANWPADMLTDFVGDCISSPLSVADTACFVAADTIILYSALPGLWDTLTIVLRPTWVNTEGTTEIVMKPEREGDVCGASGNNVVKFMTAEWPGTGSDPRLYVWTRDAKESGRDPGARGPSKSSQEATPKTSENPPEKRQEQHSTGCAAE